MDLNLGLGYGLVVNGEMRECVFGMVEEIDCFLKDFVFGGEFCNGCLMWVLCVVVEWVFIDFELVEDKLVNKIWILIFEVYGSKIYFSIICVWFIFFIWMVMERYFKFLIFGKKFKSLSSSSLKVKKLGLRKVILCFESFFI